MKTIKVKVLVSKDITACAQMRKKPKDSKWSDFICGVDLAGHVLIANSPQVWGSSFLDLARTLIIAERSRDTYYYEFRNLEEVEHVLFCDDSQALVSLPHYDEGEDDYYEQLDKVKAEQKEKLNKYRERLLRDMTYNTEEGYWEGYIEVRCN